MHTVFVVDDDPEVLSMMTAILRSKGYDVIPFDNPKEALAQMPVQKPNCAVVDLQMPGMSGMELIKRIRSNPEIAATPILVVTGIVDTKEKPEEYWAAGLKADELLPKPFDPLALLSRVEYLLRKGRYISDAPQSVPREAPPKAPSAPSSVRRVSAAELSPEEVVRVFVEGWNSRDFGAEYDTLAEEMLGGLTRTEYIARREQLYADQNGASTRHEALDAIVEVSHNVAKVKVLREDYVAGTPHRKEEDYMLRRTSGGWKIVSVRSKPLPFSIE